MVKSLNIYNLEELGAEGANTSDKVLLCTADAVLVRDTVYEDIPPYGLLQAKLLADADAHYSLHFSVTACKC